MSHTPVVQRRRFRLSAVLAALTLVSALLGGACAPASPPAGGGGLEVELGPLTLPLPPITARPAATTIPLGLCQIGYQPPGVQLVGATVTIPRVRIDPARPVITVPDVVVRIPQLRIPVSTVTLSCGLLSVPTQVDLIIPSTVVLRAVTLDMGARTITLQDPFFTIDGAGIGLLGLGDLIVPLPPIVGVPLPTTAIAF